MVHSIVARLFSLFLAILLATQLLIAQKSESTLKGELRAQEALRYQKLVGQTGTMTPGQEEFDVTYYRLDLILTVAPNYLNGSVQMVAKVLSDNLSAITLDLMRAMTVDSVTVAGNRVGFSQQPATLNVTLNRPYAKNEMLTVKVFYRGVPGSSGFGSFVFAANGNSPWVWTLSEPYGAKDWWPCKDHPSDKADSVDISVTCDSRFKVGSEGKLVAVVGNVNGTKTHRWQHRYPIATYLVSIAVAEYAESSGWFKYGADSMVVLNYAIPGSDSAAKASLPQIVDNLRIYSDLFGLYPFFKEKYGHSQFGWGGGMEHQTMTSLVNFSESLIAHEMAHQWFGDMITCRTWPNIWLNEGFASYCEALYFEKKAGTAGYRSVINADMAGGRNAVGSIYVRDTSSVGKLFDGNLVYSKGSSTLHMLRHVIGDSAFFKSMRQYANDPRFRFGTATTEGFQSVCEAVSGRDLSYFFNEWIYGENCPSYVYEWGFLRNGNTTTARVTVRQTTETTNPTFFTMPLDLKFTGDGMDTTIVVMNNAQNQTFVFTLPKDPTALQLDPGNWILKKPGSGSFVNIDQVGTTPKVFALMQNYPNPFNPSTIIPFELAAPSRVRVEVYNALGALVSILVDDRMLDAGKHEVLFNGTAADGGSLPSGVYYYRLKASGSVIQTRKMICLR
jgi:aminopeptidase N